MGRWGLWLEGQVGVLWTGLCFGSIRELGTATGHLLSLNRITQDAQRSECSDGDPEL